MSHKIKPFFESTLAKDAQLPGSDIVHKAGAKIVIQAELHTKRFGDVLFTTPNATDAFMFEATELAEKCNWLVDRLNKENPKYSVWSKLNSIPGMTAERAMREDPEAKKMRHANDEIFYRLIVKTSELLFVLIAGVEAMVNSMVPSDYIHDFTNKKGENVKLNKLEFEVRVRLEDKLIALAKLKAKTSPKQEKWWSEFKTILDYRNDIVHLKTKNEAFKSHNTVYASLVDLDVTKAIATIRMLLEYYYAK